MSNFMIFPRFGSIEMMIELRCGLFNFKHWLKPTWERWPHGELLMWCGPLHVAIGRYVA